MYIIRITIRIRYKAAPKSILYTKSKQVLSIVCMQCVHTGKSDKYTQQSVRILNVIDGQYSPTMQCTKEIRDHDFMLTMLLIMAKW